MAYYLQMDGVDDSLQLPTMTATKIIIDCNLDSVQDGARDVLIDTRTGGAMFLDVGFTNARFYLDGGATVKTNGWNDIPKDSRHILDIRGATDTTAITDNFTICAKNDGTTPLKGKIYGVTLYNLTTLVAQYDMTLGNVQDQSGNGNHATLTGGTWVDDGSGGGGIEPVANYFRKRNCMGLIF